MSSVKRKLQLVLIPCTTVMKPLSFCLCVGVFKVCVLVSYCARADCTKTNTKCNITKFIILCERRRAANDPTTKMMKIIGGVPKISGGCDAAHACRVRNVLNIHTFLHKNTKVRTKGFKKAKKMWSDFAPPLATLFWCYPRPAQRRKFLCFGWLIVFWTAHGEGTF